MPVTWTAEADRRLLLLVLDLQKVNNASIATAWADKYGAEGGENPTARAISERLYKLKNMASGGKSAATTPRKADKVSSVTPKTGRVQKPATPASKSKSKRKKAISDGEQSPLPDTDTDSDVETKPLETERTPRQNFARATKTIQTYGESEDTSEESDDFMSDPAPAAAKVQSVKGFPRDQSPRVNPDDFC